VKRLAVLISLVMIASLVVTCGPTQAPEVIEKEVTREVEVEKEVVQEVEKEVTEVVTVKETVVVEGTSEVVEVEVTKVVPAEPAVPSVIRFPLGGDPSTLEPALALELYTGWIAENLHASLLKYNENSELVPHVAERYEVSDDGLTYTFYLRDDAKFHNGRSIVAQDIKANWERYLDPNVASQVGPDYLGAVVGAADIVEGNATELSGFEIIDDLTFRVTTEQPDPGFLLRLASPLMAIVPPEAVVEGEPGWVDEPVGAGPFRFVEWRTNEKITLEAWDDFFLGRPSVDRIEYLVVPDAATAMAQYEAGELDIVGVTYSDLERIKSDPVLSDELHSWTRARMIFFCPSMDKVEAFQDKRVRQAFNLALDRQTIIEDLLFNAYTPAVGYVPPSIPEFNPDLEPYAYDPERARELMAEAGYPDGEGFPALKVTSTGDLSTELEAFAALLNQNLGVDIEVEVVERGELFDGWFEHGVWDIFRWGWSADFPSAEVWLHQLLYTDQSGNCSGFANPEYDAIVDQARTTLDEAERTALWRQAEEMAMEEAPMIPFGYDQYFYLVKPNITGFTANYHGPTWFMNVEVQQ
jgi:oligopeptide transport system substrate-binding protein